jgi:hypothetical protein
MEKLSREQLECFYKSMTQKLSTLWTECNILNEPITKENPPYTLSFCKHYVSYNTLKELPVKHAYDENRVLISSYVRCPQCRKACTHADLDLWLLNMILLKKEAEGSLKQNKVMTTEFFDYFNGQRPRSYTFKNSLFCKLNNLA